MGEDPRPCRLRPASEARCVLEREIHGVDLDLGAPVENQLHPLFDENTELCLVQLLSTLLQRSLCRLRKQPKKVGETEWSRLSKFTMEWRQPESDNHVSDDPERDAMDRRSTKAEQRPLEQAEKGRSAMPYSVGRGRTSSGRTCGYI